MSIEMDFFAGSCRGQAVSEAAVPLPGAVCAAAPSPGAASSCPSIPARPLGARLGLERCDHRGNTPGVTPGVPARCCSNVTASLRLGQAARGREGG